METQKTLNIQSSLEKKNGAGGINLPDFRLYYKVKEANPFWHTQAKFFIMWYFCKNTVQAIIFYSFVYRIGHQRVHLLTKDFWIDFCHLHICVLLSDIVFQ